MNGSDNPAMIPGSSRGSPPYHTTENALTFPSSRFLKMNYSVLAELSRYPKGGGGIETMSETIRELFKDEIAAGRAEKEGSFITNLLKLGRLAFSEIAQCAGVPLSRVQDIANSLGIHES